MQCLTGQPQIVAADATLSHRRLFPHTRLATFSSAPLFLLLLHIFLSFFCVPWLSLPLTCHQFSGQARGRKAQPEAGPSDEGSHPSALFLSFSCHETVREKTRQPTYSPGRRKLLLHRARQDYRRRLDLDWVQSRTGRLAISVEFALHCCRRELALCSTPSCVD